MASRLPIGGYMRELEREGVRHPLLHETPRSGQANFDMDDLALAARAQRETASLEHL